MQITTPTEVTSVAWEGELVAPATSFAPTSPARLTATIGQPEIWTVAEGLAQLAGLPHPFGAVGAFLQAITAGESPPLPSGLPTEVATILEQVTEAL